MELREGYKQTEVGVIPCDWDTPELGEILVSMQLGGNYKNSERETSWPLIKMGNLSRGRIKLDKQEFIVREEKPAERDRLFEDDVLFNTRNTLDLVGKVAIWRNELPVAYFNSNLMRMKFEKSRVASYSFINSILNTPQSLSSLRGVAIGTTSVAAIYSRDLVKVRIPLPTKAEQEAIAEALSDADALIESLEQLIAKKRQIKQGAMQELLTGNKRLSGFTEKWEVKKLGQVGKCYRGVSYSPSDLAVHDTHSTVRLLRSNNVQNSLIVLSDMQYVDSSRVSEHQRLQANDVLICMANGSRRLVGKAGQFRSKDGYEYTFGAFMGAFRPNSIEANADYVFMLFDTEAYRHHIDLLLAGSSINNLTPNSVEELQLPMPCPTEQAAIAEILIDMDAEIAALETKLAKARQVKQGMMQELLTGNVRLIQPEKPHA